ncbi:MAG: 6-phosphogluconolactonase [Kiritimatiellia bacterium]
MSKIEQRRFDSAASLNEAVASLLKYHLERDLAESTAVMLSGGKTPLAAYRILSGMACVISPGARIFLSDERLVPDSSPESNFGNMRFVPGALGMEENQFLRVKTDLAPEQAAQAYNAALRSLVNGGASLSLGLLGLGADGHTASLFSSGDLDRARGRYAIAVAGPDGLRRVSVTPDFLAKIHQVVFVVSGADKRGVADKLSSDPGSVIAGRAVAAVKMKEIWYAE